MAAGLRGLTHHHHQTLVPDPLWEPIVGQALRELSRGITWDLLVISVSEGTSGLRRGC